MENMEFTVELPYPEIKVSSTDVPFAKKLLAAYASKDSEMTAITGYSYRSIAFGKKDPELSRIMAGIARVEMMHLNILAKLIWLLGYDPKYRTIQNDNISYWNAEHVNYKKDTETVLKSAIAEEKGAYDGYIMLSRETDDRRVSKILYRLALDEQLHAQILENELQKRSKKMSGYFCTRF